MKRTGGYSRVIRPITTIGFSYMIALAIACYLPFVLSVLLFVISFIISFLITSLKRPYSQRTLLILVAAGIGFGVHSVYTYCSYQPALKLDGKTAPISAVVTDIATSRSGKSVLTVKLDHSVIQTPTPVNARLYLDEPGEMRPADWISGTVSFYLPSEAYGKSTPLQSAKADNVYLYAYAKTTELTILRPSGFQLSASLYDLRLTLQKQVNSLFSGENAAVFRGMLTGDNSALSNKTYRDFIHTGILHIMVVSGLHLVIISQFLIRTLKAFRVKRKPRYLIGMTVIPFFMAIAGFTPSVNRAGVMLLLLYAAKLLDRDADSLTSIGLVGLGFTLFSPYLVTDLGFQLTYLSTIGIILFADKMAKKLSHKLRLKNGFLLWAVDAFCVTPAVLIFTLPITALRFQAFPILAPVFNFFLSPVFTLVLTLGMLTLLFSFIPLLSVVAEVLATAVSFLIDLVRATASFCTELPFSYTPLGYCFVYFWIIASILLMIFITFLRKLRYRYTIATLICALSLIATSAGYYFIHHDSLTVATCTQGEDSAVVLAYQDQMIILNYNELALQLTETTHLRRIPLVSANENLALLAEYAGYYQIDTVCTDSIVPDGTIACREVFTPDNAEIDFLIPLQLTMRVHDENVYYRFSYGNFNLIYGHYDKTLESLYEENKENIYILKNDCNSVFQKPIKYVIMLNGTDPELQKQNPGVTFLDTSKQGITPIILRPDGNIKIKEAGQWLY